LIGWGGAAARQPLAGWLPSGVIWRRTYMWYLIFFTLGAVVGSLATFLRYETKCRDCGVRENCEEFP
jgi:hypothetical protein